jgi:predicted GNAT family N-acyltransferase
VPKCWETKYDMLLQMVNVQNFDAKIYQHVIKWQKAVRLIQYCCMLVAGSDVEKSNGRRVIVSLAGRNTEYGIRRRDECRHAADRYSR